METTVRSTTLTKHTRSQARGLGLRLALSSVHQDRSWGSACLGGSGSRGGVLSTAHIFWRRAGPARKACGFHPSAGIGGARYALSRVPPTGGVEGIAFPRLMHEHVS